MTTETKYTAGPWHVVEGRLPGSLEIFSNKTAVAELWRRADVQKEMANARLIAAAPELLEALVAAKLELWRLLDSNGIEPKAIRDWPEMKQCESAIAKATGETQ